MRSYSPGPILLYQPSSCRLIPPPPPPGHKKTTRASKMIGIKYGALLCGNAIYPVLAVRHHTPQPSSSSLTSWTLHQRSRVYNLYYQVSPFKVLPHHTILYVHCTLSHSKPPDRISSCIRSTSKSRYVHGWKRRWLEKSLRGTRWIRDLIRPRRGIY